MKNNPLYHPLQPHLEAFRKEFCFTSISIEDLRAKYGLSVAETAHWTKDPSIFEPDQTMAVLPDDISSRDNSFVTKEAVLDDIKEFKARAVKHALEFMRLNQDTVAPRELRELSNIVTGIEGTYKEQTPAANININIANLMDRLRRDDC